MQPSHESAVNCIVSLGSSKHFPVLSRWFCVCLSLSCMCLSCCSTSFLITVKLRLSLEEIKCNQTFFFVHFTKHEKLAEGRGKICHALMPHGHTQVCNFTISVCVSLSTTKMFQLYIKKTVFSSQHANLVSFVSLLTFPK